MSHSSHIGGECTVCMVALDDAKSILKEIVDSGGEHDGFKVLLILEHLWWGVDPTFLLWFLETMVA